MTIEERNEYFRTTRKPEPILAKADIRELERAQREREFNDQVGYLESQAWY